jgi:hypothetical protein
MFGKIPVTTNTGGVIYYNDVNYETWFELDDLNTFNQIDFYLTLGNALDYPIDLNGGNISLKVGILVHRKIIEDMGGMKRMRVN